MDTAHAIRTSPVDEDQGRRTTAVDHRAVHAHDQADFGQAVAVGRMITANRFMSVERDSLRRRDYSQVSGASNRDAFQRKLDEFVQV